MEIILSVKNGNYYLRKISDDRKRKVTTNNQQKIYSIISCLNESAVRVTYYGKDVRLSFGEGRSLILKDYDKNQGLELYSNVLELIDENTRTVKTNINRDKFKYIAATGVVIVSMSIAGLLTNNKSESNQVKAAVSIDNITLTPIPTPTVIQEEVTATATPSITPTIFPTPIVKDASYRIEEALKLCNSQEYDLNVIPISTKVNGYFLNKVTSFFETEDWQYYNKCGLDFGVDPYLLLALSYGESHLEHEKTLPGGSSYNGHAVGLFQHEHPEEERNITAYNYSTNQYETMRMCMTNACDKKMNTRAAAMILQGRLYKYNNNIYITIQSYNYGEGAMDFILKQYADEKNTTVDEVINDYSDTGWLKYVKLFHYNPNVHIPDWEGTYGNDNYIQDILGFYIGKTSENRTSDGNIMLTDLVSLEYNYEEKIR